MADPRSRDATVPGEHARSVGAVRVVRLSGDLCWPVLLPHLVRSVVLLVPVAVSTLVWAVGIGFGILGGMGMVGGGGFTPGPAINSGLTVLGVAGMTLFGMIWIVSLFAGVREVVAEDGLFLAGGASGAATVASAVEARLRERAEAKVRIGRVDGYPVVRVKEGREEALILVRSVGDDLRIGWAMWRSRSTVALVIDVFPGRRGDELALLQHDAGTVMWEAVTAAVTVSLEEVSTR
jgi:hypothetical protein